jgi:hypothetical protein
MEFPFQTYQNKMAKPTSGRWSSRCFPEKAHEEAGLFAPAGRYARFVD